MGDIDTEVVASHGAPAPAPEPVAQQEESRGGAPGWIVTFADMMSLLLCFFVLLLASSSTDAAKFKQVADSLREAFQFVVAPIPGPAKEMASGGKQSPPPRQQPTMQSNDDPESLERQQKSRLESAQREIDRYIAAAGLTEHVETKISANALKIVNSNPLNFPPGKAQLLESSRDYLNALLPIVEEFDFNIVVEGHTDSLPIQNAEFASNWELSAGRAATFVHYLERHGVDPTRLSVHGFGPHRPVAPNDTDANRARNRRIEILFSDAAAMDVLGEF